ncbi:MAG: BON domain-containing protein [Oligoflexia bacterium]|nr:BON domain-containing protein [Oligoflexia bacterium]
MKRIYRLLITMTSIFLLVISIYLNNCLPSYASKYVSKKDAQIETATKNSFVFQNYLRDEIVNINSKDGVVTLSGTVSGEIQKYLAKQTVEEIGGVRRVEDYLKIKNENTGTTANHNFMLRENVKNVLLFHHNINTDDIKITDVIINDGIVTINGSVSNHAQKELIGEYIKDVEGVKNINNNIVVLKKDVSNVDSLRGKIDDASITAQVKAALLFHRSTSAIETKVKTIGGIVTVSGKAKNIAERDLVTKLVKDIKGVTSTKNHMTIE